MKKHRILLFASKYKSSESANGICARNLVREFVAQGCEVFVIAVSNEDKNSMEEIDGAQVWYIRSEWLTSTLRYLQMHKRGYKKLLFSVFSVLRALMLMPFYPNGSRCRVRKIVFLAKQLIEKKGIDMVIGTCLPYDGIPASIQLKNYFGDRLRVVTYHFDIISIPNNKSVLISLFKKIRYKKAFREELSVVDRIYLPESAEGLYYSAKISIIGLPVYLSKNEMQDVQFKYPSDCINVVYIGTLDSTNRSPKYLISVLRSINSSLNDKFKLHIWGYIADAETQELIDSCKDCVSYHGILDNSTVYSIMAKSDYLVNVSNAILYELIPSKIFSMFASGKPIINIVNNPDDCTLPFFDKYNNSVRINSYESVYDIDSILTIRGKHADADNLFKQYMPSYIVKELLN